MYNIDVKEVIERLVGYFKYGGIKMRVGGIIDVDISDSEIKSLKEISYLLAVEVVGNFSCIRCKELVDFNGIPSNVYGNFYCIWCDKIKSLENCPNYVKGGFYCRYCMNLSSLENSFMEVEGDFDCSWCNGLKEIKRGVKKIKKDLICKGCQSLEYISNNVVRKVGGKVYVSGSDKIKNLDELIEEFGDKIERRDIYV